VRTIQLEDDTVKFEKEEMVTRMSELQATHQDSNCQNWSVLTTSLILVAGKTDKTTPVCCVRFTMFN
jgi:hypothetical protein